MLKAEDLARREDRRVRGIKIGKSRRNRGKHMYDVDMNTKEKITIHERSLCQGGHE